MMSDYINRALAALEDGNIQNANTLALIAIANEIRTLVIVNEKYYRYTRRRDEINYTAGQDAGDKARKLFDEDKVE